MVITIFSVITRSVGFLYKIFLSRILTTEMLGIYNISLSIFGVFATILCSGISITIARFVSINYCNKDNKRNNNLMTSSLILCMIIALAISLFIITSRGLFAKIMTSLDSYILLICLIPAIISCAIYTPFKSYLFGREYYLELNTVELIEQLLRVVVCLITYTMCKNISAIYAPTIAICIAALISTIIGIVIFFCKGGRISSNKIELKPLIKKSTPITLVRVLSTMLMPVMAIILPLRLTAYGMSSSMALSLLGVATGMVLPLLSIPGTIIGSLSTALIPHITTLYECKEKDKIHYQISSSYKFTIVLNCMCIPIFMALGVPVCKLLFNNIEAGVLLRSASWVMLPMGISQLTTTIINSMGYEKSSFLYYIISSVLLLTGIYFLPKYIGVESVIWALGVSSSVVAILNIIKIKKLTNSNYNTIYIMLCSIALTIPVYYLIKYLTNILSKLLPLIINIGICGIAGCIAYTLLAIAFGLIEIEFIRTKLRTIKIKPKHT